MAEVYLHYLCRCGFSVNYGHVYYHSPSSQLLKEGANILSGNSLLYCFFYRRFPLNSAALYCMGVRRSQSCASKLTELERYLTPNLDEIERSNVSESTRATLMTFGPYSQKNLSDLI